MALAAQGLTLDCPNSAAPGAKVSCKILLNEAYSGSGSFGAQFVIDAPDYKVDLNADGSYVTGTGSIIGDSKVLGDPVVLLKLSKSQNKGEIATFNLFAPSSEKSHLITLKNIKQGATPLADSTATVKVQKAVDPPKCAADETLTAGKCVKNTQDKTPQQKFIEDVNVDTSTQKKDTENKLNFISLLAGKLKIFFSEMGWNK